jgi:hypothetical protein
MQTNPQIYIKKQMQTNPQKYLTKKTNADEATKISDKCRRIHKKSDTTNSYESTKNI